MILMNQMMACCGVEPVASGGTAWWLADGAIAESEVFAAFDPNIASSVANSMVNLANPGINDLEDIDGDLPILDGGWLFTTEQWMRLPKKLEGDLSLIVRWKDGVTDQSNAYLCGVANAYNNNFFSFDPGYNNFSYGWKRTNAYFSGSIYGLSNEHSPSGTAVLVNSATDNYARAFFGSETRTNSANVDQYTRDIHLGGAHGRNRDSEKSLGFSGRITHFAAYNAALTDAQAEAIRAHVDSL